MKRLFALLLALVMVLSMAACGEKITPTDAPTDPPKTTDAPNATDAPTEAPTDAPEIDIWAPFEETVTLSIPVYEIAAAYPEGDSITNNQWIRVASSWLFLIWDTAHWQVLSRFGSEMTGWQINSAYAWGAYPKTWIDDGNGNVVYGSVQPEMKDVLAAWAQWVKDGIVSDDFATTDSATYKNNTSTGKYGLWIESNYYCGTAVDLCISADTLLTAYEIPTATGDPVLYPLSTANAYYHVISKDCEHPEAFIKLLNYYAYMINSGEVAAEDLEVSNSLQGIIDVAAMFRVIHPRADVDSFYAVDEAIKKESSEGLVGSELTNYNNYMDVVKNGNKNKTNLTIYGQQNSAYQAASTILEEGRTFKNMIWDVKPQTQMDMGSALDDILLEGFTKIVLGHESIDYFDTLVAAWEAAGGAQMTIEANEIVKGK